MLNKSNANLIEDIDKKFFDKYIINIANQCINYIREAKIKPLNNKQELFWERCLSLPGLHGKVPRYTEILVTYQNLEEKVIKHKATSTWAALIQHECDHLDGILYPMRMKDLSKFGYNDTPGDIATDALANKASIDPLFLDLVRKCPKNKLTS